MAKRRPILAECACSVDIVASLLTYDQYVEASTFLGHDADARRGGRALSQQPGVARLRPGPSPRAGRRRRSLLQESLNGEPKTVGIARMTLQRRRTPRATFRSACKRLAANHWPCPSAGSLLQCASWFPASKTSMQGHGCRRRPSRSEQPASCTKP